MGLSFKAIVEPKELTQSVFTNSMRGKISHFYWRYILNAKRAWSEYQHRLKPDSDAVRVANDITEKGLVHGPAISFLGDNAKEKLAKASEYIHNICESEEVKNILNNKENKSQDKDYMVRIVPFEFEHQPDSPLLKLALDKKLLETISTYLGMWPKLQGIGAWLNFPTEKEAAFSQLWHRDPEDLKTVKVFIYLDAVNNKNGPFTYIMNTHPFGSACDQVPQHNHHRRITDEEMVSVFPKNSWIECTGPSNTMVIADTVGFHRGGNVKSGKRILITFTYTSGSPQKKREWKVTGKPDWISEEIQKSAI